MRYFINLNECKGTCYHEFYKGKWKEETFWSESSIYLHDDILLENKLLLKSFQKYILNYSDTGVTEINFELWVKIRNDIFQQNNKEVELVEELDTWLWEVFKEYDVVTILGI